MLRRGLLIRTGRDGYVGVWVVVMIYRFRREVKVRCGRDIRGEALVG